MGDFIRCAAFRDKSSRFGPCESRAFAVGKEARFSPCRQGVDTLLRHTIHTRVLGCISMQKAHPLIWEALILTSSKRDKVRLRQTSNFQFRVLPLHIRWRGPKIKRDLLATPFQYLFLVYCSVEKLMHQRPNPIHFFFQREMARVEKMELCTGNISFKEFSTLHRKDSIVFAPSDQHGGLAFTEILLPIGIDIQIPFCVVED